jgi:hypothetical protein
LQSFCLILHKETNKKAAQKLHYMSLDNIQLPTVVVQDLFKKSLVDLKTTQPVSAKDGQATIAYLGQNQQGIVLLVQAPDSLYLPDNELDFLMGILTACRLTMADVALVNLHRHAGLDYQALAKATNAAKVLLFGLGPEDLQLPLSFPPYQIQRYNNQVYLAAPPLPQLQADRMEKSKLWACLKQVFGI